MPTVEIVSEHNLLADLCRQNLANITIVSLPINEAAMTSLSFRYSHRELISSISPHVTEYVRQGKVVTNSYFNKSFSAFYTEIVSKRNSLAR